MWGLAWQGTPPASGTGGPRVKGRAGEERPAAVYPAGKLLAPHESKLANEHKPLDREGRPLCWGALTHLGCTRNAKECGRSHVPLQGKFADLHWTVQAQFLRRVGLRTGKAVPPSDIDGRIAQLRSAAKAAAEAAQAEGRASRVEATRKPLAARGRRRAPRNIHNRRTGRQRPPGVVGGGEEAIGASSSRLRLRRTRHTIMTKTPGSVRRWRRK